MGEVVAGPFEGHKGPVWSVAFSPDGQHIVSGSYDQTVQVWDAKTGKHVMKPFEGHTGQVWSVAFSPDGQQIVSGSYDHIVLVWSAKTGKHVIGPFEGHTGPVSSVAFSPDAQHIVSGSHDQTMRVWNAKMNKHVPKPFEEHTYPVSSVAFSSDGHQIVSGLDDHTVHIQNMPTVLLPNTAPFSGSFTNANQQADFAEIYHGSRLVNGWIQTKNSKLLFWLPPYYRRGLWGPNATAVMGRHTTKLDFSQFVHGTSWTQCYSNSM
jgi:WD40 repeat protein